MLIYYGVMEHLAPWRERTPHKQSSSFYNRHCSILLHHPKVPRKVRLPYPAGEQVGNLCPGGCANVTADSEVVAFSAQGLYRWIAQDSTLNPRPKTTQTLTHTESGSLGRVGSKDLFTDVVFTATAYAAGYKTLAAVSAALRR